MKFVIIGRTATGKHYLAEKLSEKGLTLAPVFTTNTDTPAMSFYPKVISDADAQAMNPDDLFYMQSDDNTETFMKKEDIAGADIVILHPNDLMPFHQTFPDEALHIIHTICLDSTKQDAAEQAHARGYKKPLKDRQIDETPAYSNWEQRLAAKDTFGMEQLIIITFDNDYCDETMNKFVTLVMQNLKIRENVKDILRSSIRMGLLKASADGNIIVEYLEPQTHTVELSLDNFYDLLVNDPMHFTSVMTNWLAFASNVTRDTDEALDKAEAEAPSAEINQTAESNDNDASDNASESHCMDAGAADASGVVTTPDNAKVPVSEAPAAGNEAEPLA